jgi:hypothetical protein
LKVPASVPSLRQMVLPAAMSKTTPELTATSRAMPEPVGPGVMSLTRRVPAVVPSVFQSSEPVTPSSARKYIKPLLTVKPAGDEPRLPG